MKKNKNGIILFHNKINKLIKKLIDIWTVVYLC